MRLNYPPEVVANIERGSKTFEQAVEEYERRLFENFDRVAGHLVGFDLTSILDIGCGLGGMDILLAGRFEIMNIHLQDGVGEGPKLNKFSTTETVPWNDVRLGKVFVEANTTATVTAHMKVTGIAVNAILSFRAWGHHFPIDVYRGVIDECLMPDGIVMTDIRLGTDGIAKLEAAGLVPVKSIPHGSLKCERVIFRKPAR